MDQREFQEAKGRLGDLVIIQMRSQFPALTPDLLQWNLLRIFGLYVPVEEIAARETTETCTVCWSHERHDESSHDFSNKQMMANLLLSLESSIRNGEV